MGFFFEYGWDVFYYNFFNVEDFYYEGRFFVIYFKGKKVLVIGIFRNIFKEFFNILVVEYQFEKMVIYFLVWYK